MNSHNIVIFQVAYRETYKTLPIRGWFHPCYGCFTPTGIEKNHIINNTKYIYYLCKDCNNDRKKKYVYNQVIRRFRLHMPNG